MNFFRTRYRVVQSAKDMYFSVQVKPWWCPFWYEHNICNIQWSLESSKEYIRRLKERVVYSD